MFAARLASWRALSRAVMGTTIRSVGWGNPEEPAQLVEKIEVPLVLIHGEDDHFFSADDAREMFERAAEPKKLIVLEPFGHAEDGFTPAFATRLLDEIDVLLETSSAR